MNIALIGYGKMGKAIEKIALEKNHTIGLKISSQNSEELNEENLKNVDVAIEFTNPHSVIQNISFLLQHNIPVVCGSTGWNNEIDKIHSLCLQKNGSFLWASNFSVGVNLFFEINKYVAQIMNLHSNYNIHVEEIHHTQKKDAPSGTAITIAEQIIEKIQRKSKWINTETQQLNELEIISKRKDPAPGTHIVKYLSEIDDIEISHTAHNRIGFASGALLAAEYIYTRKGIFNMKDVLGL